jgi:hypothetical protein
LSLSRNAKLGTDVRHGDCKMRFADCRWEVSPIDNQQS